MKSCIVFCLFAIASVAMARPEEKYTDRYDDINLDEILSNRRLLVPYVKCVLDQGKCAPDAKELKDHIKDALETDCSKCTDKQLSGSRRVLKHLYKNEKDYYNEVAAKYDPQNIYFTKHAKELE